MLHRSFAAIFPAEPAPAEAAEPAPRTVPNGRLRSTCDFCTKRKKKCDGDGVNRCRCAKLFRLNGGVHVSFKLKYLPRNLNIQHADVRIIAAIAHGVQ